MSACYRAAHALVSTSLHEGFCVPLVEAMAFGVPIVALERAATPETVGDAGRLIVDDEPSLLARAIAEVVAEGSLRRELIACGRLRFAKHYSRAVLERQLLDVVSIFGKPDAQSLERSLPRPRVNESNAPQLAGEYLESISPYPGGFEGRGIVICAGGGMYNVCAWVAINLLRWLGCALPIQVWFCGLEERDDQFLELLRPLGVEGVDGSLPQSNALDSTLGGWELKVRAVLHCPFREVLLLDADNVPVADPAYLFDEPEYQACGAMFWPDISNAKAPENPRWNTFGVAHRDEPEIESGQVLVDKQTSWRAIKPLQLVQRTVRFLLSIHLRRQRYICVRLASRWSAVCDALPPGRMDSLHPLPARSCRTKDLSAPHPRQIRACRQSSQRRLFA